jgi:hypothetical protein
MGDEALDTFSAGWYAAGLDTPEQEIRRRHQCGLSA